MTFEIIVGLFIITNTCLQLYWFRWSRSVEQRKHFTDSDTNGAEIDFITNLEEYLDLKIKNEITIRDRDKEWQEFISQTPETPETPETPNAHLERDHQGKFNHEEIDGALDGMFAPTESPTESLKEEK